MKPLRFSIAGLLVVVLFAAFGLPAVTDIATRVDEAPTGRFMLGGGAGPFKGKSYSDIVTRVDEAPTGRFMLGGGAGPFKGK